MHLGRNSHSAEIVRALSRSLHRNMGKKHFSEDLAGSSVIMVGRIAFPPRSPTMRTVVRLFPLMLLLGLLALPARPADPPAGGKKVALVVGINKYHHADLNQPKPLEYAEADAQSLADLLKKAGYKVTLLRGEKATHQTIAEHLKELREAPGSDGVFLVAFAGHGLQPEGSKEAYFVPYDAKQRLLKPDEKDKQPWDTESLVPLSEVIGHLRQFGRIAAVVGGCVPQ